MSKSQEDIGRPASNEVGLPVDDDDAAIEANSRPVDENENQSAEDDILQHPQEEANDQADIQLHEEPEETGGDFDSHLCERSEETGINEKESTEKVEHDLENESKNYFENSPKQTGQEMFGFSYPRESTVDDEENALNSVENSKPDDSLEEENLKADASAKQADGRLMFDYSYETKNTDDHKEACNVQNNLDSEQNENNKESVKEKPRNNTETSTKQTVECRIVPSDQVITLVMGVFQTVQQVKEQLSSQVKVSIEAINIIFRETSLPNPFILRDLNIDASESIHFTVIVGGYDKRTDRFYDPRPSRITVTVDKGNGERKLVIVEIIRPIKRKPFLGGYRHKFSGLEYHHASAQTNRLPGPAVTTTKECRDSQTVFVRTRNAQTDNTTSTQMSKLGCFVSNNSDTVKMAGDYVTADEYLAKRLKAVIILQSHFRRIHARKIFEQLRADAEARIRWQEMEELKRQQKKEARIKKLLERIANPKTRQDFHLVYAMLEKWRFDEEASIRCEEWNNIPEMKAALYFHLLQECQYISTIERKKCAVAHEAKEHRRWKFLCDAALPKQWRSFDGRNTVVETPYTRHAAELKELYDAVVNSDYLKTDERLEILSVLRSTVQPYDCSLVRELILVIEREVDLLMRGVPESRLQGLRARISTLFFLYCKNPVFNPETHKLHKVNNVRANDIFYCVTSQHYLPSGDFYIKATSKSIQKCKRTKDLENVAYVRQDLVYYSQMLTDLRRKEANYKDDSKVIYLVQEGDLQHLVENVWLGQSILSGSDDFFDLEIVRWDKQEEWSPWNCILLNHDEAQTHLNLDHLEEAYGQAFIERIKRKHMESRVHYSKVPGMAELLRRRGPRRLSGDAMIRGRSITCTRSE